MSLFRHASFKHAGAFERSLFVISSYLTPGIDVQQGALRIKSRSRFASRRDRAHQPPIAAIKPDTIAMAWQHGLLLRGNKAGLLTCSHRAQQVALQLPLWHRLHSTAPGIPDCQHNGSNACAAICASAPAASSSVGISTAAESSIINKQVIATSMTDRLYHYLLAHTREPQVLRQLREETASMHGGHMQVSPEQGQFLGLLVQLLQAKRVLEVGVFTGYSSLAMALALPQHGTLVAIDKDETSMAVAQRYWHQAGVADRMDARLGPALESLQQLLQTHGAGSFDLAFIDADKRVYDQYYELCLQLVRPGGVIAIDNVLFYGRVADPEETTKATVALRELNNKLLQDDRVTVSILPVGDGMALCLRRR